MPYAIHIIPEDGAQRSTVLNSPPARIKARPGVFVEVIDKHNDCPLPLPVEHAHGPDWRHDFSLLDG
jgi:hypothetical protein